MCRAIKKHSSNLCGYVWVVHSANEKKKNRGVIERKDEREIKKTTSNNRPTDNRTAVIHEIPLRQGISESRTSFALDVFELGINEYKLILQLGTLIFSSPTFARHFAKRFVIWITIFAQLDVTFNFYRYKSCSWVLSLTYSRLLCVGANEKRRYIILTFAFSLQMVFICILYYQILSEHRWRANTAVT